MLKGLQKRKDYGRINGGFCIVSTHSQEGGASTAAWNLSNAEFQSTPPRGGRRLTCNILFQISFCCNLREPLPTGLSKECHSHFDGCTRQ